MLCLCCNECPVEAFALRFLGKISDIAKCELNFLWTFTFVNSFAIVWCSKIMD